MVLNILLLTSVTTDVRPPALEIQIRLHAMGESNFDFTRGVSSRVYASRTLGPYYDELCIASSCRYYGQSQYLVRFEE
jgi:hypothetical protein